MLWRSVAGKSRVSLGFQEELRVIFKTMLEERPEEELGKKKMKMTRRKVKDFG